MAAEDSSAACSDVAIERAMRNRAPMGRWRPDRERVTRFLNSGIAAPGEPYARMLLSLPEDWWPRTTEAAQAASTLSNRCAALAQLLGHYDFLANCKGRWGAYLASLTSRREQAFSTSVEGALDMVTMFETQVVGPAMHRLAIHDGPVVRPEDPRLSRCVAARLLLGDKGLRAILDLSDRWHRMHERIEAAIAPDFPLRYEWPAPFPELVVPLAGLGAGNALRIAGLTTPAQLHAEGTAGSRDGSAGLGHCVASYWQKAATGGCAILSVRLDLDGRVMRLSTMEMTFDRSGAPTVVQHRAGGNADPKFLSQEAERWLVQACADGDVQVAEAFMSHDWPTREALERLGYDRSSNADFGNAVRAWGPLLARNLRDPRSFERAVASEAYAVVEARHPNGRDAFLYGFLPPRTVPRWGQSAGTGPSAVGPTAFARMFYAPRLARRIVATRLGVRRRGGLLPALSELAATLLLSGVAVAAAAGGYRSAAAGGGTWGHGPLVGVLAGSAAYAAAGYAMTAVLSRLGAGLRRHLSGETGDPGGGVAPRPSP